MVFLQIDFDYSGPTGDKMAQEFEELAESIKNERGFICKIWTENEQTAEAGGAYIFEDIASCRAYLEMHTKRLQSFGIKDIRSKIFNINKKLSHITKAPFMDITT